MEFTATILSLLSTALPCSTCCGMVWNWKLAHYCVSLEVDWIVSRPYTHSFFCLTSWDCLCVLFMCFPHISSHSFIVCSYNSIYAFYALSRSSILLRCLRSPHLSSVPLLQTPAVRTNCVRAILKHSSLHSKGSDILVDAVRVRVRMRMPN